VFQFEKIRARNPFVTVSLDKVIEASLGRRQLDLGHEQWLVDLYGNEFGLESPLGIRVLLMENYSFELIGKLTDLVLVVGFLDALQQIQNSVVGCVHRGRGGRRGFHFCSLYDYIVLTLFGLRPLA
jgi:hypothetical protein